jgi:16S rRNA (cytidine1402-2'-O)-methyltransferase
MLAVDKTSPNSGTESGTGTLYLVPTPLGNPRDMTLRAIDVLERVEIVACEDTRHARTLLQRWNVGAKLLSYHDFNEEGRTQKLLGMLRAGTDVAVISDAGTPLINDPGFRIVAGAISEHIRVCPLPGASAPITALIGSGLPVNRFYYAGFLPRRSAARRAALKQLRSLDATMLFFEAPHRILETVREMHDVLGDRPAALARNLSKADERFIRGPLSEVIDELAAQDVVRGQYTMVVGGIDAGQAAGEAQALADRLTESLLHRDVGARVIREVLGEVLDLPRNEVYERVRLAEQQSVSRK